MRLAVAVIAAAAQVLAVAGAATAGSAPEPTRYVDEVFGATTATLDVTFATAPDLVSGRPVPLRLDVIAPAGDTERRRPALVWIHRGGFAAGSKEVVREEATAYARRGFVSVAVNYRLDPGNRCQAVQDDEVPATDLAAERARCAAALLAAQHDATAAARWVRANAARLGVDPGRVAAIGFSAGAVTALNPAYRSHDAGSVGGHADQDPRVQAAVAASGCLYDQAAIGPGDAPVFLLHTRGDPLVPWDCALATADRARAAGLTAETMLFGDQATHARALYAKYRAQADAAWTAFLVRHLDLAPPCAGPGGNPEQAAPAPPQSNGGTLLLCADGAVFGFGDLAPIAPAVAGRPAVDVAVHPAGGYWVLTADGAVIARGAPDLGDPHTIALRPGERWTAIAAPPTGAGLWAFTSLGRVAAIGSAGHHGDLPGLGMVPAGGIVAAAATPSGQGYLMVGADGGVFAFGDARFHGSMGGRPLNRPVVGGAAAGRGYLLVAADGGVFSFSPDRPFLGSLGSSPPPRPIVAVATR